MTRVLLCVTFLVGACSNLGDVCSRDEDCGEGLACGRPGLADGGLALQGICTEAQLARGETCGSSAECGPGLYCSNQLPTDERQRFGTCLDQPDAMTSD